ncbi:MAG: hypothetical protein GKR90_00230 [Pseudomonadales bacterium]|nr:hypothetical protein [Pseudomonadales bacterium]
MADNQIRGRAKANFPTVLLTLLSIVQALELMWTHLGEHPYLYEWSFLAVLGWLQIAATLLGILLIWLIYSGLVMRFSWVPSTSDAIFPFLVGIIEFAQIGVMGPSSIGIWFIILSILFAIMAWVTQVTMRRARHDSDNDHFFANLPRASWADHISSVIPVVVLLMIGLGIWVTENQGWFSLVAVALAFGLLANQLRMTHVFTQRSYQDG